MAKSNGSYKQRRQPKAKHFDTDNNDNEQVFTKAQFKALVDTFPEFIKKVNEFDPHWKGNCHQLTSWKKAQCTCLLDSPPFADVPDGSTEKIRSAMMRKYSNIFNYNMKKQSVGKPDNFTAASGPSNPAFIAFTGTANPRQLFLIKNQGAIEEQYHRVAQEEGIRPVVAYQRVIKEMWDNADHEEWTQKAQELESDIETNCTEFSLLMEDAFNNLLERGVLGTCALSLSYAWRNAQNEIEGGKIHAAFDSNSHTLVDDFHYDDDKAAQSRWAHYVEKVLPRKTANISTAFERTDTGLPLFPNMDLKKMSMDVLIDIMDDFFLALWDHIQDGATEVPWEKIEEHPWRYFDDTHFLFPKKLRRPSSLDLDEIFPIARYLITMATDNPFTFYNKGDIQEAEKLDDPTPASPTLSITHSFTSPPVATTSVGPPPPQSSTEERSQLSNTVSPTPGPNIESDKNANPAIERDDAQHPPLPLSSSTTVASAPKLPKQSGKKTAQALLNPINSSSSQPMDNAKKPAKKRGRPPKAGGKKDTQDPTPIIPADTSVPPNNPSSIIPANTSVPQANVAAPANTSTDLNEEGRRHAPARKRKVPSFRPESVVDHTKTPPKRLKQKDRWAYVPIVD